MNISRLISGGLITNYHCSSKCRHCLYNCSPNRSKQYIDNHVTKEVLKKISKMGCQNLHIGGGEPFLNPEGLSKVLSTALETNMQIEYVETNSSWFKNEQQAIELLKNLKEKRLSTLLISISPFHNEFIAFSKVKGVINACQNAGMQIFPWIMDFYSDLDALDEKTTHSLEEYQRVFSRDYIQKIPQRYWIHLGGRAAETYRKINPLTDLKKILNNSSPCHELTETSHFHIDLFQKYIPGLCSGFGIDIDDLEQPLNKNKYPLITTLLKNGISKLLEMVSKEFEFKPKNQYLNKCDLCLDIRFFLYRFSAEKFPELSPDGFYC